MSEKIENAEPKWTDGLIMVCTKCGRKLGSEEISNDLKKELKSCAKESGKSIRAVTTSCLDICPKDQIAVAFVSGSEIKAVVVDAKIKPQHLFETLTKT